MRLWTYYRKKLLENLNIKTEKNDVVLDVWCFDWYWLSIQIAKEKHAIDIDINPIYKDINYKKWDATQLPYEDNYFNKVFSFDVIEHVNLWKEKLFLSELYRVTKNWWEIIFTTPSKDIKLFPNFLTTWVSKKWGHYKCNWYTKEELVQLIWDKENIKILELNSRWYLNNYLFLRLLWNINKTLVMQLIDKITINDSKTIWNKWYILVKIKK